MKFYITLVWSWAVFNISYRCSYQRLQIHSVSLCLLSWFWPLSEFFSKNLYLAAILAVILCYYIIELWWWWDVGEGKCSVTFQLNLRLLVSLISQVLLQLFSSHPPPLPVACPFPGAQSISWSLDPYWLVLHLVEIRSPKRTGLGRNLLPQAGMRLWPFPQSRLCDGEGSGHASQRSLFHTPHPLLKP